MLRRSVDAFKRLGPQLARGFRRKEDNPRSVLDGNRPVIAGYIPVKLVMVIKEPLGVADGIPDVDRFHRVDGAGDVDLELEKAAAGAFLILELAAVFVCDGVQLDEDLVVGPSRTGIVHRDITINAVIFAAEGEGDLLFDAGGTVLVHVNVALEI